MIFVSVHERTSLGAVGQVLWVLDVASVVGMCVDCTRCMEHAIEGEGGGGGGGAWVSRFAKYVMNVSWCLTHHTLCVSIGTTTLAPGGNRFETRNQLPERNIKSLTDGLQDTTFVISLRDSVSLQVFKGPL